MPALLFPNPDLLRLVLASGVVPAAAADVPARAGYDDHGRPHVEPGAPLPRETLAALARLGVRVPPEARVPLAPVNCWAELLPLRPSVVVSGPPAGDVLFELPDGDLARFVADLHRLSPSPLSARLLPDSARGRRAWVMTAAPPFGLLLQCAEAESGAEAFTEQRPGVWVRLGWEHPLPDRLVRLPGALLLLRPPRGVAAVTGQPNAVEFDEYRLPRRPVASARVSRPAAVAIPLKLVPVGGGGVESLWVADGGQGGFFWEFCRTADERVLRRLEAALIGGPAGSRVVVRVAVGKRPMPLSMAGGFAADPRVPGLFLPVGAALRPPLRANVLARVFEVGPGRVTWVEPGPGSRPVVHSVLTAAFRPVPTLLEYTRPDPVRLVIRDLNADPFPLLPFGVVEDRLPPPEQAPDLPPAVPALPGPPPEREGWLSRIAHRFRRAVNSSAKKAAGGGRTSPPRSDPDLLVEAESDRPAGRNLGSADALLHGPARTARRQELEARLLDDLPRLSPGPRAERWAELAALYAATGSADDAAVCWVNAAWETDPPPAVWLEQWFAAETRAARKAYPKFDLDHLLRDPIRPGAGRVAAAYSARAAHQSPPPPELLAALPRLLALLDRQFDDLPVRAAWLARLALARVTAGDTLGMARWRDRVLDRLREKGTGLDLDVPSFLRFHGTASPDRFRTAREWLVRARDPILKWVAELGSGGRLQWAGIDPETDCTAAYAQLLLAWGLGCLGERTRARDWVSRARKVLGRAAGPGIDPAVHSLLADLFAHRVRDAQDGRPAKPGLPDDLRGRHDALAWFSRFAVDRLRDHCRVLDPADRVRAFRGLDLKEFRGHDQLGERLHLLADRTDPAVTAEEARQLLTLAAAGPSSATLPRVTFTLLELAPHLDEHAVVALLGHAVPALDWTEAWLQAGRWTDSERADRLPDYQARLFETALAAAAQFNLLAAARPLVEYAVREAAGGNGAVRRAVELAAGGVFRALRKLGFRDEAEALLRHIDPVRGGTADGPFPPSRLGLALGWLAVGDEDAGLRILDAARDKLFLDPEADDRSRTELAVAYAGALGFAPPRVALGRLEELFQRLIRVSVKSSTNRYYTLKPLELIDTVVRSVVTDDFALGPAVRGWLDDDEFLVRRRVHRDLAALLREQGVG
jgi:hypothetical protein